MDEGSLLSLDHVPDRGRERVSSTEPEFVAKVYRLFSGLKARTGDAPPPRDPRLLAQLIWSDGSTARVAVPKACDAMTKDGVPVEFDRELYELLVSRLAKGSGREEDGCPAR